MGVKLTRAKKRKWLLTIIYRLSKIPFISPTSKLKFFLDLEWIFDRLSHEYSFQVFPQQNHPIRLYSIDFLLEFINSSDTIIDVGCKYGENTNRLAETAKKVIGVDYDNNSINLAKALYQRENLTFINQDVFTYLKENSQQFDVAILSHVLEHLDDPKQFLLEIKKSCHKLYIEVPDFEKNYLNLYRKEMNMSLLYSDTDHINEFDRVELTNLLTSCEIKIIKSEYRFGLQKLWCST